MDPARQRQQVVGPDPIPEPFLLEMEIRCDFCLQNDHPEAFCLERSKIRMYATTEEQFNYAKLMYQAMLK